MSQTPQKARGEANRDDRTSRSLDSPESTLTFSKNRRLKLTESETNQLAVQVKQGEEEALEKLYEGYVDDLYYYFYRRTKSKEEAEDLTSEAFLRAIRGLRNGAWSAVSFRGWLFKIASNVYSEWCRERNKHSSWKHSEGPDEERDGNIQDTDLLQEILMRERGTVLWARIEQLSESHKQILHLRYEEDLPYAKIAERLGKSYETCKVLHHRAMKQLRDELKRTGEWEELGYYDLQ